MSYRPPPSLQTTHRKPFQPDALAHALLLDDSLHALHNVLAEARTPTEQQAAVLFEIVRRLAFYGLFARPPVPASAGVATSSVCTSTECPTSTQPAAVLAPVRQAHPVTPPTLGSGRRPSSRSASGRSPSPITSSPPPLPPSPARSPPPAWAATASTPPSLECHRSSDGGSSERSGASDSDSDPVSERLEGMHVGQQAQRPPAAPRLRGSEMQAATTATPKIAPAISEHNDSAKDAEWEVAGSRRGSSRGASSGTRGGRSGGRGRGSRGSRGGSSRKGSETASAGIAVPNRGGDAGIGAGSGGGGASAAVLPSAKLPAGLCGAPAGFLWYVTPGAGAPDEYGRVAAAAGLRGAAPPVSTRLYCSCCRNCRQRGRQVGGLA